MTDVHKLLFSYIYDICNLKWLVYVIEIKAVFEEFLGYKDFQRPYYFYCDSLSPHKSSRICSDEFEYACISNWQEGFFATVFEQLWSVFQICKSFHFMPVLMHFVYFNFFLLIVKQKLVYEFTFFARISYSGWIVYST